MEAILKAQREYFQSGKTRPYKARIDALDALYKGIQKHEKAILEALHKDLHKSAFEAYTTEIGYTLNSIRHTQKKLKRWMRPKRAKTPFYHLFTKSYRMYEPLGQVLIIGPYNYPFHLVIEPLVGAIAAGNTAVVKPSEFTKETEGVIKTMIEAIFPAEHVSVVTGGKEVTSTLLANKFDHIFFTGSTKVGQIVYEAAAKHLTSVTLELGGKSPAIIDKTANLRVAAERIAFGKVLNAGQTCIAPDYVYIDETIKDAFIDALKTVLTKFKADMGDDYGRIVNARHYERIVGLIDASRVVYGNHKNAELNYISPTVLDNITFDDKVMQEEIFGPLLPIVTFSSLSDAIDRLKTKEKPLAVYIFTKDKSHEQRLLKELSFGGGAINDTIMHVANPHLPFGGVGNSGMGRYHGKYSFETFSHEKAVIKKALRFDPKFAYPPFTDKKTRLVRRILK